MPRVRRPRMSATEKSELWVRWKQGESLTEIGRALGRVPRSIYREVVARGGVAPIPRRRSARALTADEREEISRGIARGWTFRAIATHLARAPSTVSREVRRHGGRAPYRAAAADARAWRNARRPKRCCLATRPVLRRVVAEKLMADWSPQQIAGWLRATYPDNPSMRVSHETIYLSLFVQSRGVLKRELLAHLRRRRTMRRSQHASAVGQGRGQIVDAVSIRDRPAAIDDRAVPGHWEGDLLTGAANSHIVTLVERHSRFLILVRVTGKDTRTVVRALTRAVRMWPEGLMASLTWDRGVELAAHKTFSVATNVRVYFCDPHSPWQRGSNENTNGLLRQYFPHGTNLSTYSQADLNLVAHRLNTRPRKTLAYETPAGKLATTVAMTA